MAATAAAFSLGYSQRQEADGWSWQLESTILVYYSLFISEEKSFPKSLMPNILPLPSHWSEPGLVSGEARKVILSDSGNTDRGDGI